MGQVGEVLARTWPYARRLQSPPLGGHFINFKIVMKVSFILSLSKLCLFMYLFIKNIKQSTDEFLTYRVLEIKHSSARHEIFFA